MRTEECENEIDALGELALCLRHSDVRELAFCFFSCERVEWLVRTGRAASSHSPMPAAMPQYRVFDMLLGYS